MVNPKRHKTKFIVGDRVVAINVGNYTGAKGEVVRIVGLFTEKYVVQLDNGTKTIPIKARYLAKDKRNN